MSESTPNPSPAAADQPRQDFEAAMHEVQSNLDVRRLMIVIVNVLLPACMMAAVTALGGRDLPPSLAWLPRHVLWITGLVLAFSGSFVSATLMRCHFGLVINGTKMRKVRTGKLELEPLNWLGVTTNFLELSAITTGSGLALALAVLGQPWIGLACLLAVPPLLMLGLRLQHARANQRCSQLHASWQHGPIDAALRETHARRSLEATASDIAVIVTVAAALFAGTFGATCSLGAIGDSATLGLDRSALIDIGGLALMLYTALSLLLTARMIVRLRIALAQHAARLAEVRHEHDEPWRFRVLERTYLLYLLVAMMTVASGAISAWMLGGERAAAITAAAIALLHLGWYPWRLAAARRADARRPAAPG